MKKSEIHPGSMVVIRGVRTAPNTIRCARVLRINKYSVEVEFQNGSGIPQDFTDWPPGPRTQSPSEGEVLDVKLADVLRKATVTDQKCEQEEWDEIRKSVAVVEELRAHGVNALISPEWPVKINVRMTNEDAQAYAKTL